MTPAGTGRDCRRPGPSGLRPAGLSFGEEGETGGAVLFSASVRPAVPGGILLTKALKN
ncbi:hypothetical protein B4135_1218 [Caldibacillus debilis]|uniref:Uncharacterized protein n=1 Tax=Caldibacillus debilis TaxID=301148 RepID=A0A150MEL6_9BACI|nr:hypothetical protein B4135_1218 [Caldibacillus debilis]